MASLISGPPTDWKNFLIRHRWMPTNVLLRKFDISKYDVDNFRRKSSVSQMLAPWRISVSQPEDRLRRILEAAWRYYICDVEMIDTAAPVRNWVPALIALKKVSRGGGFSFLTHTQYLDIVCPSVVKDFRARGFTNIALALFEFWPGRAFLSQHGVLPYMFQKTRRAALTHVDVESMIEHVYLNFVADEGALDSAEALQVAKAQFLARHDEPGFITGKILHQFGVPCSFYDGVGLRAALRSIALKYSVDLAIDADGVQRWSAAEFRKRHPGRHIDACEYCGLRPVDLHHLVPRHEQPTLTYDPDNIVALCVQVHGYISRRHWTPSEDAAYRQATQAFLRENSGQHRSAAFAAVMQTLHASIYGSATHAYATTPQDSTP